MASQTASQACRVCRRLKRKCTRELPACSLCLRLNKTCEYPGRALGHNNGADRANRASYMQAASGVNQSLPSPERSVSAESPFPAMQGPDHPFPQAFFLDQDLFTPLGNNDLACGSQSIIRQAVSPYIDSDLTSLYEDYFSTIHAWLPMISKKRLLNYDAQNSSHSDACHDLFLLCMKLCATKPDDRPARSRLYTLAKSLSSAAEAAGFLSLRLVQSTILIAFYELSHAIYPAAYLTVGRAARLSLVMGLNKDGKSSLFKPAETWTLREEQRRTWWALFVLDRFTNIETNNLPFVTSDPSLGELLPVNDRDWDAGKIVASESLYTPSFSSVTALGHFASTCQAAHMLSKVLHHKHAKKSSRVASDLLHEAFHLHQALSSLQLSIETSEPGDGEADHREDPRMAALALCTTARIILYGQYACHDAFTDTMHQTSALETDLQNVSLQGITALSTSTVPRIAQREATCPFLAQCLYYVATECAWFLRENNSKLMQDALGDVVRGLGHIGQFWVLGVEYISLLEQESVMDLLSSSKNSSSPSSTISAERMHSVSTTG